jgi:putative transposase
MKLIVNLKLQPSQEQARILRETLELTNQACNEISAMAWAARTFKQFNLHKLAYQNIRNSFNLSAQMVVRSIAKVADAYKLEKNKQRLFRKHGAISYDDRIISFKKEDKVSIWTTEGRQTMPFLCGDYQRKLFPFRKGEVDLIYRQSSFYLNVVCDIDEPEIKPTPDILGVDFGVVNIATDSDGQTFSGAEIERVRQQRSQRRQMLQHKASRQSQAGKRPRSIHHLLKRLSGREQNFKKHTNHYISKQLVRQAQDSERAVAIESLTHIRSRTRFRRSQRARMSGWSFAQLRQFVD